MEKNSFIKCDVMECVYNVDAHNCGLRSINVTNSNISETCCGSFVEID